jgi:hypothetical protein
MHCYSFLKTLPTSWNFQHERKKSVSKCGGVKEQEQVPTINHRVSEPCPIMQAKVPVVQIDQGREVVFPMHAPMGICTVVVFTFVPIDQLPATIPQSPIDDCTWHHVQNEQGHQSETEPQQTKRKRENQYHRTTYFHC